MGRATNSAIQANANKPKPSAYIGEVMHNCFVQPSNFSHTCVVVVSGDSINFCGHALLHTGGGLYVHVAVRFNQPKRISRTGYGRYLRENDKQELRRFIVPIPNPEGAHRKLEELLAKPWRWLVLPNNCVSFVEEVVRAGGSNAGMYFNEPVRISVWNGVMK